jgi:peroxiredoxin Q/BCP
MLLKSWKNEASPRLGKTGLWPVEQPRRPFAATVEDGCLPLPQQCHRFLRTGAYGDCMKKILVFAALLVGGAFLLSGFGAQPQQQLASGTPAPNFSLTTSDGSQVSLKDYRGKWIVLYFYPKDFTSGCTLEAKNFQRDLDKYQQAGVVVLGVSVDSAQSHKDFCAKEGLNFKLLSDPDATVSTEYGSTMEYQGAKMAARNTFIINPKGEIAKVYTGVKPAEHSEQVLKDLAQLQKS